MEGLHTLRLLPAAAMASMLVAGTLGLSPKNASTVTVVGLRCVTYLRVALFPCCLPSEPVTSPFLVMSARALILLAFR